MKRVVKSTLTAETLALQEVIEVAYMIRYLLLEIVKLEQQNQILHKKCITGSKSLHDSVYSSETLTEKRLKIELCAIWESLEKAKIHSVTWVKKEHLIKEGASHKKLYDVLSGNSNNKFIKKRESRMK